MNCPKCHGIKTFRVKGSRYRKRMHDLYSRHRHCVACGFDEILIEIPLFEYERLHKLAVGMKNIVNEYSDSKLATKQTITNEQKV